MPFNALASAQARAFAHGQVKFVYSTSTTCILTYGNGDLIKINGVWRRIPQGGVTITNAGLVAQTLYYCYAYWNGSAVTLEFSTTGRATSTAAGNEGVMVKNGDDSRSLVGMVWVGTGNLFYDRSDLRWVRSWFNDNGVVVSATSAATVSTSSTATAIELDAGSRVYALLWTGEFYAALVHGSGYNNTANAYDYLGVGFAIYPNGLSLVGSWQYKQTPSSTPMGQLSNSWGAVIPNDGSYYFNSMALVSAGTVTFTYKQTTVTSVRR
ncbi:hypothetical protein [Bradyrhizobium diazoefficiens]|nr:hypothetical protein XF16B_46160 [Bradyrhizobium diazoefficiens]BCF70269.1 hypothetical protein XF19B_46220 [Bradyrhizobium diazoefficiens]